MPPIFPPEALAAFETAYPDQPSLMRHALIEHPLLELDALAALAERLPPELVSYNLGDLPITFEGTPERPAMSAADAIRTVERSGTWVVMTKVEQDPAYAALLETVLAGLRPLIEPRTGPILMVQGYIFVTSPGGVVPFHFDPEHNILMQVRGSKTFTHVPSGNTRFAPDEAHELFHATGKYTLPWRDDFADAAQAWTLAPGDAVYMPVKAPHFVRNGDAPSVSISLTWRSAWSFAEADARRFNGLLRKIGLRPVAPRRWPHMPHAKSLGWRILRKLGAVH